MRFSRCRGRCSWTPDEPDMGVARLKERSAGDWVVGIRWSAEVRHGGEYGKVGGVLLARRSGGLEGVVNDRSGTIPRCRSARFTTLCSVFEPMQKHLVAEDGSYLFVGRYTNRRIISKFLQALPIPTTVAIQEVIKPKSLHVTRFILAFDDE